jgi:hypothetical protein
MLSINWARLFSLLLWILPHALLGVVAAIIYGRRLYRKFPCFFAYVLYEIAEFILLFTLYSVPSVTNEQYGYVFSASLMLSIALRFGVIDEISRNLFHGSPLLTVSARRLLQCVQGLLLVIGILLAIYAPGNNGVKVGAGLAVVNRGVAIVQSGILLCVLCFSRLLGVSLRRPAFGITLGLGVLSSVDLAIYAVRAEFGAGIWVPYFDLLTAGTYLICTLIWLGYLLAPELEPVSLTVVAHDEVETWNREVRQWLRH